MAGKERKAVLVLPEVGLSEKEIENLRGEFQNSLVTTLKGCGANMEAVVVIIIVVVVVA